MYNKNAVSASNFSLASLLRSLPSAPRLTLTPAFVSLTPCWNFFHAACSFFFSFSSSWRRIKLTLLYLFMDYYELSNRVFKIHKLTYIETIPTLTHETPTIRVRKSSRTTLDGPFLPPLLLKDHCTMSECSPVSAGNQKMSNCHL